MTTGFIRRLDAYQREHRVLSFPLAVVKHYGEDGAGSLAAAMSCFGVFSLFPLLLVLVSVAGLVIGNDADLQQRLLDSALAQFPVIGVEIRRNVGAIEGTGVTVVVGIVVSLWAGIGGVRAAQSAFDSVWGIEMRNRPTALGSIARAILMLLTVGAILLGSALLAGIAGGSVGSPILLLGSAILNIVAIAAAYRILTAADLAFGDVVWGAVVAGIGWTILLALGGWIVQRRISGSSDVYGGFALVIGLMAWIYLGAQLVLIGLEVNVVRVARLWPRSWTQELTDRDAQALRRLARREERHRDELVETRFVHRDADDRVEPPSRRPRQ